METIITRNMESGIQEIVDQKKDRKCGKKSYLDSNSQKLVYEECCIYLTISVFLCIVRINLFI
jgi:hypothetical protein